MTRVHKPSASTVALAVLAATASFLTLMSWDGLSDDASAYLVPLFWICAGTAAVGLALRALRVPVLLVPVLQVVAIAAVLHHAWGGDLAAWGWWPTRASVAEVSEVLSRAATAGASWAAPVPAQVYGFAPLMIALGAAVVVLVDALACSLRQVALAGLPLLAAFTAPVSILGGVPWGAFAVAAAAFVLMLAADQAVRLAPWGRNLAGTSSALLPREVGDSQPHQVRLSTLWPGATRLGLAGVGVAVLAPLLLPTGGNLLGTGSGSGDGSGEGGVRIDNPLVDIKRDLVRGADVPVIRLTTDDPDPGYLRLTALDDFDGAAWRPSDRDIPVTNRADGRLPVPPGLQDTTPRVTRQSEIEVLDTFDSTWLPVPYPATEVRVNGDWRFDDTTLDVVSAERGLTASGADYRVSYLDVRPDAADLASAAPPARSIALADTRLPSTMPPWVGERALEVTAGARSDFERAVILQDWFRRDGGFTYSLERSTTGSSVQDLERFLGTGPGSRTGYCEQFSSAMAMMARTLGIPARVAVGFLRPDPQPDGSWVYSFHDSHAWPELYFTGVGWIRFEPTPQTRADEVPGYTLGAIPAPGGFQAPTVLPSAEAPARSLVPTTVPTSATGAASDTGLPSWWWIPLPVLAVGGLALLPRGLRRLVRRRRFSGPDAGAVAEGAWAELRATAIDLGLTWPDGATLRRTARALVPALRPRISRDRRAEEPVARDAALRALEDLVVLVERARYSRAGLTEAHRETARGLVTTVSAALRQSASPRMRRRARWWPASLVRGGARGGAVALSDGHAEAGRPGDRVSV